MLLVLDLHPFDFDPFIDVESIMVLVGLVVVSKDETSIWRGPSDDSDEDDLAVSVRDVGLCTFLSHISLHDTKVGTGDIKNL